MRTEQTFKASRSEIVNQLVANQIKSNRDNFDRPCTFGMGGRRVKSLQLVTSRTVPKLSHSKRVEI
jgi:hypothetical protein